MIPLLGPADADHFRVKVGRYGDRWYHDPLPADEIAEATDAVWPSISTCKGASGKDWSFVSLGRAAAGICSAPERVVGLPYGAVYDALKSMNERGLEAAGLRGTNIHLYCESKLRGTPCFVSDGAPGTDYFPAVDAFFDVYQPELVVAEYVTVHRTLNGVGYGGTPDAIVRIGGKLHPIDWKSRTATGEHGAYPEEGAQIAAGARADYMIVEGETGPERRPIPNLDDGLIISIKPDGCRVYPVDLDRAWEHWTAMHAWWVARQREREGIGRPWTPRKVAVPAGDESPGSGSSPAVPPSLDRAAQIAQVRSDPDEGGVADAAAFAALQSKYAGLTAGLEWIAAVTAEATQHGVSFHAREMKSIRRFGIILGLTTLAEGSAMDDETVRAVLASVIGDVAWFPNVTLGHLIGSLSADEAALFAQHADTLVWGDVPAAISPDGHLRLEFAA